MYPPSHRKPQKKRPRFPPERAATLRQAQLRPQQRLSIPCVALARLRPLSRRERVQGEGRWHRRRESPAGRVRRIETPRRCSLLLLRCASVLFVVKPVAVPFRHPKPAIRLRPPPRAGRSSGGVSTGRGRHDTRPGGAVFASSNSDSAQPALQAPRSPAPRVFLRHPRRPGRRAPAACIVSVAHPRTRGCGARPICPLWWRPALGSRGRHRDTGPGRPRPLRRTTRRPYTLWHRPTGRAGWVPLSRPGGAG